MKKITQYDIMVQDYLKDLIAEVNDKVAQGWVPVGGMSVATSPDGNPKFYQAMVKQ